MSVERAVEGVGSIEKQFAIHTFLASKVVQTKLWIALAKEFRPWRGIGALARELALWQGSWGLGE